MPRSKGVTGKMSVDHEELVVAYKQAQKDQGYETPDQFWEAAYDPTVQALASGTKARDKVAVHRDSLTSIVWPQIDRPEEIDMASPDGPLQMELYKYANAKTWELTKPLTGRLQSLLAKRNGLVLCRLGGLLGDRVYVTKDPECFRVDVMLSRHGADIGRITKLSEFYGNVSERIPGMAATIAEAFDLSMRQQVAAGRAHIPLLVERDDSENDESGE